MLISIDEEEEEEEEGEEGEEGVMKLLMELNSEPGAKPGRVVPPRPNHGGCEKSEMPRKPSLKDPASKEAKLFRRRFRVPFAPFPKIVKLVKDGGWLSTTAKCKDVAGRPCKACPCCKIKKKYVEMTLACRYRCRSPPELGYRGECPTCRRLSVLSLSVSNPPGAHHVEYLERQRLTWRCA